MSNLGRDIGLPRVAISYCTQCRWLLRAAYYAQELLTTFGDGIGEVALLPTTGGKFTITLTADYIASSGSPSQKETRRVTLWDRKEMGGFPETKVLKQLVRDQIDPDKSLGHSDKKPSSTENTLAGPNS